MSNSGYIGDICPFDARYLAFQRDEPRQDCNEFAQDLPETLVAFWGNRLERIQERAERHGGAGQA